MQNSPAHAEHWLIQNQAANSLPNDWARAYILGLNRGHTKTIEEGLDFIAKISTPNDHVLENFFIESHFFQVTSADEQRLMRIRQEAKR